MDLRSLNYFTVVAEELNFTRASERLCMSQPPLSNQIKALEEELGVRLFIRGGRSLQLTEAGKLLYRRASQLLDLADRTREEVGSLSLGLSGTLSIGSVTGRAPFYVAQWLADFREEFPLVRFEIENGSSDDITDRILRGLLEIGVIAAPFDNEHLEGIAIGDEPWCAIMSDKHPLAHTGSDLISLKELASHPIIVPHRKSRIDEIRNWFAAVGEEPTIIGDHSSLIDALALAEANVGVSIFPQTLTELMPGIVSKKIIEPSRQASYYLVHKRNVQISELSMAFVDFVLDYLEEHQKKI